MNDDPVSQGSKAASNAEPFVAPVPGLGGFTPPPDPYAQATFRYERSVWLLAPLAFWTVGVAQHSTEAVAIALFSWIVSYPVYAAWSLWRLKDANPKADLWPPIALLMLGSIPFVGFLPVAMSASTIAFDTLVLMTYVAGIAALVALRTGWPRTRVRGLVMAGAAAALVLSGFALAVAIGIAVAAGRSQPLIYDYIFGVGALVLALLIALLGFGLLRATRRLALPA